MLSRRDALALPAAAGLLSSRPFLQFAFAADTEDPTKVFTDGKKPTDARLGAPKTLNDYFPFVVPKSKEAWEARRKQLREQLLVATGLWPLPEKTPLNATVHGKIDKGDYTIEKVYFASTPGHYVCGNLYRPVGPDSSKPAKFPGVLFAHGHWENGRLHDAGEKAGKANVDGGGEPDMDRGRYFLQALPATLAKLGFVVFHYDMVGVADSTAIPHGKGFADAEGELRLQSAMGLQTWNSVRALDFLAGLPDVDTTRLGMTGASGGGTQTFMLAAIDDRLAVVFPAVMVSTGMQGGCVCENCSLLRVNTGNVEIAGLFAPKPQAMSAANDWTKELMTKGYPELQQLYGLYGAKDKVAAKAWLEYGHQYNVHAREMMYAWLQKHLQGKGETVKEPAFKPVAPTSGLSVFDDKHPRPKDELGAKALREVMAKASDEQIAKLTPKDAESLKEFQRVVGTALQMMVNSELPKEIAVRTGPLESKGDGHTVHRAVFGRKDEKDAVPACGVIGAKFTGDRVAIWLHPQGKASLFEGGKVAPAAKSITDAGVAILAPDLLGTGENRFPKSFPVDKGFAGYTHGYNRTLLANRAHDVLTLIAFGRSNPAWKTLYLVGWNEFGPVAILAKALAGDAVAKTAADMNQFKFEDIKDTADPMLLPGAVKYGGLGAFLALCAPGEVLVHNHKGTGSGQVSRAAYEAAGAGKNLTRSAEKLEPAKVVEWLVK
ncbi:acetylxylan esterase [Gemmata sp. G18]|uniref:Acetylxylan esterase n=1 Tax=Gemmata palustris TaxID=2822762 RepID=A0ABS5C1E3_9BACT|nr:CocE/NonD family hydrolase [Gemmata palustris]MBP3959779.1 acetylxylan esterase [Gemmata palustris]